MIGSKHGRPHRGTAMSAMVKAVTPNKKHRKQTKPSSISQSTETIVEIDTDNSTTSTTTTPVVTNAASETPPLAQDMEVDDEASTDTRYKLQTLLRPQCLTASVLSSNSAAK